MHVRSRNDNRQRCAERVHQKMPFRAQFAAISRIFARFFAALGCCHAFTFKRLPLPLNAAPPIIVRHEQTENRHEDTLLDARLITRMNTIARTEPFRPGGFPSTARAQNIRNPVQDLAVRQRGSPYGTAQFLRRQNRDEFGPQFIGNRPKCVITHRTLLADWIRFATSILQASVFSFKSGRVYG